MTDKEPQVGLCQHSDDLSAKLQEVVSRQPQFAKLIEKLLTLGGELVVAKDEPDLEKILAQGRVWSGPNADIVPGKPSDCHLNAASLWLESPTRLRIVTGWALSSDGLWRQHSWILEEERIIETTEQREIYYGYALSADECRQFADQQNWLDTKRQEMGESGLKCDQHPGMETYGCFMCHHLLQGSRLGLHQSYGEDDYRPDSWCNECELARQKEGEWNDRSESFADIQLVCNLCYDNKVEVNQGMETDTGFLMRSLEIQGWCMVKKYGESSIPSAFYTIGLTKKFKHPEIFVSGLPRGLLDYVIEESVLRIRRRERFVDGRRYPDLIGNFDCHFRDVLPKHLSRYMPEAVQLLGPSFNALQCVWPDKIYNYPWDTGFSDSVKNLQPELWK